MEKTSKDIRIQKELYNIDKNIHDMYINMFECKCTHDMLCREFIDVMSKYELNKNSFVCVLTANVYR
jgi:hypothetical protein